nr:hypothetical protein [Rhizobium leguminosarum]
MIARTRSYFNSLDHDRLVAEAINFDSNGDVTVPLQAISESVADDYETSCKQDKIRYLQSDELPEATDAADEELACFREQMATTTASEFLVDDRLVPSCSRRRGSMLRASSRPSDHHNAHSKRSIPKPYINN